MSRRLMQRPSLWLGLILLVMQVMPVQAEPVFPKLEGRVVDEAGLISAAGRESLVTMLQQHEAQTSNQLVVVTLASLQGYTIEDYGYQLGRHWGIGQKDKNNGALLLVAPNERKVRIEVGYGLEGTLTDALSKNIIETQILPQFKSQHYEAGIVAGVEAILGVIDGSYTAESTPAASVATDEGLTLFAGLVMLGLMGASFISTVMRNRLLSGGVGGVLAGVVGSFLLGSVVMGVVLAFLVFVLNLITGAGGSSGGGYSGGGGFSGGSGSFGGGGGFSGGGGSFGGGGSSGSW